MILIDNSETSYRFNGPGFQLRQMMLGAIVFSLTLSGRMLHAQEKRDLTSLSVDDLMNVEVTSVSRKEQKMSETAAAIFVITQDDIRRSGATSIPEILRMVPGLDVARVNGNVWAISARGSNGQFANKLLVMIDGRSVYTPLFSGVFWDVQDTLLVDIDRIEVVRGPGGTLWGANAVNGVINIITKHAVDTQGTVAIGGGGSEGTLAGGRYGGSFGQNGNYRVYGKTFDRHASMGGANLSNDAWTLGRGGFRADWASRRGDTLTAQGDIYRGSATTLGAFDPREPLAGRSSLDHLSGGDLQFRWTATQSSRSDITLQAYYDSTTREMPSFDYRRRAFDIDFQQHLMIGTRNDAVWGVAYRTSTDHADSGSVLQLARKSSVTNLASAYVQDEIQASPRLRVTIGTKALYERYDKPLFQPTVRLLFKASERQSMWAAATSAIRIPSEIEENARINVGAFPDGTSAGGLVVLTGNPDLLAERVQSFEIGYRIQATANAAFDVTAFHNRMRDLVQIEPASPTRDSSGQTVIPINFTNNGRGHADGLEFLFTDSVTSNWTVSAGYSLFRATSSVAGSRDSPSADTSAPRHQVQLRSSLRLPRQVEWNSSAYYVGRLGEDVPSYLRLDTQLSWHPTGRWTLSVTGQNLLQSRHAEFAGTNGEADLAAPIQRSVNGTIVWRF